MLLELEDIVQAAEEPLVNVSHLVDLLDRVTAMEGRRDRKDTLIRRINELLVNIFHKVVLRYHVRMSTHNPRHNPKNAPAQTH